MNERKVIFFLIVAALTALNSYSQQKDTLFLYSGQVLLGDILTAQTGVLNIDETDLKRLSIRLYKIKHIKSLREFKIETIHKEIHYGSLHESYNDGWIEVHGFYDSVIQIKITDINSIVSLEKEFFERLRGTLSSGFSYTKSGGIGQITLNANIRYVTRRIELGVTASEYISIDSSVFSRDKEQLQLLAGLNFTPTWFVTIGWNYQRNLELSLARRFQELVGIGNKLILRSDIEMYLMSGITFNQEKSTSGVSSKLLLEVPFLLRFDYFKFANPNIQIGTYHNVYVSLSEKGRYRYDGSLSFSWEIFRNFSYTLNPSFNFDSKPSEGTSNFDYSFTIGFSYKL